VLPKSKKPARRAPILRPGCVPRLRPLLAVRVEPPRDC
jgi:hypothetical protein